MNKSSNIILRILVYILGLFIIALGINISKMATLGISPVSSIPGVLNAILDGKAIELGSISISITLGTMVVAVYIALVLLQLVVLGKKFKLVNALGVLVGIVFGYIVDLVGIQENAFGHLLLRIGCPAPADLGLNETWTFVMCVVYLLISIVIIGIGVYIYLKPALVPMPAEGLAQAISTKTNKAFGNCKTIVDTSLIAIALILQIIFLGGFATLNPFGDSKSVVGIGTIVAAILVGQVVKLIKKTVGK